MCGGAFTSFKRVVFSRGGRGWFLFLFRGRSAQATIIARRPRDTETATDDPRASRQTKESEAIAGGNFRALRGILISEWRFVNRKYPNLNDDTLLHIACREGYLRMVQFITDTKNQPQFENTELDVDVDNGKWRAPASRMSAAVSLPC